MSEANFDKQLGVAETRMSEHDRRLESVEEKSEKFKDEIARINSRLENIDARLTKMEETMSDVKKSVDELVKTSSKMDGFLSGVKVSTNFWYIAACVVFSIAGYCLSHFSK